MTHETTGSLTAALAKVRIPLENHEFIRRFCTAADISDFNAEVRSNKSRVVARRRDGGPDLHIYYGYTTGFASEDELLRCAGGVVGHGLSTSRKGTWYVKHPTNKVRD